MVSNLKDTGTEGGKLEYVNATAATLLFGAGLK